MSRLLRVAGVCLGLAGAAIVSAILPACAEEYPDRPVRIILTVAPSGSADATARILGKLLTDKTRQTYLVENKPGAAGMLAVDYENNQKPDGYALLYASDSLAIGSWLVGDHQQSVASVQDLTPITVVGVAPFVIVTNPKIPAKTPPELVSYIKAHPDFRWSIGGIGVPGQLAVSRFSKLAGLPLGQQIPYKGNGPAILAAMNGEADGMAAQPPGLQAMVAAGQLTAIGVASLTPIASMPGVPTIASFGYPGFEALSWYALFGPKNMPAALARKIRDQVAEATKDPEFTQRFAAAGFTATVSDSPEAFGAFFKGELAKNHAILDDLNIKAQTN